MDASNLGPKVKNMRFVDELCKQDSNCNKLIKEFETILEFYFGLSIKISPSDYSPIMQ
jgi:hypothetical protein